MLNKNISLANVMNTMAEGVFVLDDSCSIVLWNQAMEEMTGWRAAEMIGKSASGLLQVVAADGCSSEPQSDCAILKHVGGKPAVRRVECRLRTRDSQQIPVFKNARVLTDDRDVPVGVVTTLTDLRPLRRLQDLVLTDRGHQAQQSFGRLVGASPAMQAVYERIHLAARSDATVLVTGETGTGKELVADAIHYASRRASGPFVKVNCSALSENLLESELFGHVQGAFTGATADKIGRLEMAEGGTLFLDEIGDLTPMIQLKLLRVLQEHEYERVGESTPRHANVRFITATHRDLKQCVAAGEFREDFFYRVRVFAINVPPLRDREDDIPLLCEAFIAKLNQRTGKTITTVSPEVAHSFVDYCWPGNVRELENALEHAFVICHGSRIELDDLPAELRSGSQRRLECSRRATRAAPKRLTKSTLLEVLDQTGWNRSETARRLGVDRTTVWRKMKQWKLTPADS